MKNLQLRDSDLFVETHDNITHKRVVVAIEGEHGCAPLVALSGFVGERKPVAYFVSRFMRHDSINTLPEPEPMGWPIYSVNNTYVVLMRQIHTPESLGMHSQTMWTYYYPVFRDLAEAIRHMGSTELEMLNVTYTHEVIPDDMFQQLPNDSVNTYDMNERPEEGQSVFLHAPAWMLTSIFTKLKKSNKAWITSIGWDADGFIDEVATQTLIDYLGEKYDWDFDSKSADKVREGIVEAEEYEQELLRNAFNVNTTKKNPDGVMFG